MAIHFLRKTDKNSQFSLPHQIKESIRQRIRNGDTPPETKILSEQSLADEYGVSRITARHALIELINEGILYRVPGKGTFVSSPSINSRNVTASLIMLIVPNLRNSFYYQIISGIEHTVTRQGYEVILRSVNEDSLLEKQCLKKVKGSGVKGVILVPEKYSTANIELLEEIVKEMPLVLVDVAVPGLKTDLVVSDDRKGSFIITEHLIELGHREILHLAGPQGDSSAEERIAGYQDALKKYRIEFHPEFLRYTDWHTEEGYFETKKFFINGFHKKKATAVYACNDEVAVGALNALDELKVKVPEDVALTGYGNLEIGRFQEVPLTTVDQSAAEIGNIAANLLLDKLSGIRPFSEKKIIRVPTKLVIRQSCGAGSLAGNFKNSLDCVSK